MSRKVISVEYVDDYNEPVYDLEVEDNHNYFANGILVHNCSNPSSQQGKGLLAICKYAKYVYPMSGTPLTNSPLNIFLPLKCVDGKVTNFTQFKSRYAVWGGFGNYSIVGWRNLGELQMILSMKSQRREKKDVLDLPPKIYIDEYLEMESAQKRIYENVKNQIMQDIDIKAFTLNPMAQLLRARQATAFTKILSPTVDESIKLVRLKEILEETEGKVVIFSQWTTVTDILEKELAEYNPAVVTGNTKDREAQINKFKVDPTCKIIIGTTGALGTGFTLTEANTAIFFDQCWNYASQEQAADRIYRIGTKRSVNIISLICKNTVDEFVSKTIQKKRMMGDALIDDLYDVEDEKVLMYMLTGEGDFYK